MSLLDIKIRWKRFTIGNADLKIECKGSDYFRNRQTISNLFLSFHPSPITHHPSPYYLFKGHFLQELFPLRMVAVEHVDVHLALNTADTSVRR